MATACGSKEDRFLRERLEMDILETKKTLEKYPRQGSLVSPATTYRECVLSLKLDKDEETKLLMQMGCEPQVYDSKVKFIKGENKWDGYRVKNSEFRDFPVEGENMLDGGRINGDIIKIMKLREELKKKLLASIKDTPREETHIREGIRFDNLDNLAKWLKERQWVRAEAADAATGFIEKVKIEEDTESLRTDMLEDARDGKEINPRFSQYLYSPPSTQVLANPCQ